MPAFAASRLRRGRLWTCPTHVACKPKLALRRDKPPRGLPSRSSRMIHASEGWAHQDSNLGQAGYEPAALTAELWARGSVALRGSRFRGSRFRVLVQGSASNPEP